MGKQGISSALQSAADINAVCLMTAATAPSLTCCHIEHAGRQTFVFDASGVCLLSFNSQMDVLKHVDQALAVLEGAGAQQCAT